MADQSILTTTKKLLGIDENYTAYDTDIVIFINSALSKLREIGIGPVNGFVVQGKDETWESFLGTDTRFESIKTYVYLQVRMIFDPPTTAFAVTAMNEQIKEHYWRLATVRDNEVYSNVI